MKKNDSSETTVVYLNVDAACAYLGCSRSTIYREINAGRLRPSGRVGARMRFTSAGLDKYVATQIADGGQSKEDQASPPACGRPKTPARCLPSKKKRRRHRMSPEAEAGLHKVRKILGSET